MALRRSLLDVVGIVRRSNHIGFLKVVERKHLPVCLTKRNLTDQSLTYASVQEDSEMKGLAIVTMHNKPVNSLSTSHLSDLCTIFKNLNEDRSVRAMVLTSAYPGIFSAGLDLMAMYNKSKDEIFHFWTVFQDMWIELYSSRLMTTALINGHSPAGGCLLAMSCDYRIMAEGKFTIGLNETKLGIVAPFWLKDCMQNILGLSATERALVLGTLFPAQEALRIGLVDQVLPMDQMMEAARSEIKEWLKIPDAARSLTKVDLMRKDTLTKLTSRKKEDAEFTAGFLSQDHIQKSLEMYIQSLAKKK